MYDDLRSWSSPNHEIVGQSVRFSAPAPHGDRPDPKGNHLLASLTHASFQKILPALKAVSLPLGLALYESGSAQRYVYFPTNSIVALAHVLENGASTAVAVTGNEGLVGTTLFMGGETVPRRAVVLCAGFAYRIDGAVLKQAFERDGMLQNVLLRYLQALITQISQNAVCNRHHSIEQILSRWLLLSLDRLRCDELAMTQELIAGMLGVRRESVAEAAGKLQAREIINCRRGHITVRDRARLEASVCECYDVVKREYDRLVPARLAA